MYNKNQFSTLKSNFYNRNLDESTASFLNAGANDNCYKVDIGFAYPEGTKRVKVHVFAGATRIDLRCYSWANGRLYPTKKGICLTVQEWENLKRNAAAIDAEIRRLK